MGGDAHTHLCCCQVQQLQLSVGAVVPHVLRHEHVQLGTTPQQGEGPTIDTVYLLWSGAAGPYRRQSRTHE
jgi:hypothetical protein